MAEVPPPPESYEGVSVTVMGLGRFGGGVGVTRWLAGQGARVLVADLEPAERLEKPLAEIADLVDAGTVELRLGEHREDDFRDADTVVANPAVPKPWANPYLRAAWDAGVPVTTEIRLLVERLPNRDWTIGVTGTAGKSTTAAMIAHALRTISNADGLPSVGLSPSVWLGGNIGGSLLDDLDSIGERDWVVLELSSAQLWWLGAGIGFDGASGWSPAVAVVTNVAPNHLDWHGGVEHYVSSKRSILRYQGVEDAAVVGVAERAWLEGDGAERSLHGRDRITSEVSSARSTLPGAHNVANTTMALAAVEAATGRSPGAEALASFRGLPHRLQLVGEVNGVRVFDDSKCTTPEGAVIAIEAFEGAPVHLICGGYDKGVDLAPMIKAARTCAGVYCIGATGPGLARAIGDGVGRAHDCGTLEAAVERACEAIAPGEVLLLSPGCASWDQFENYERRGERFADLARAALGGRSGGAR
jgi:UDP-N-acetylmuramoylalanine--D-glutamate ligase